jgi:hypothetical protein
VRTPVPIGTCENVLCTWLGGIVDGMTHPVEPALEESLTDVLARVGIVVTPEGKARARARLAAADEQWPADARAAYRAELGRPARAA